MKILVTGADGYLGRGIVEQLAKDKHEVIATDINCCKDNIYGVRVMNEDIFTLENPFEYFDKPDAVLHLAWKDGFKHNSLKHIEELHLHYEFLSKLINSGIKKVAVLGTMHEVGFYEGCINENTSTNPQSLYGIAKNSLRQLMELSAKENNFKLQWIRGFYIVGNTEYGCSIFSKIIQAAKEGKKEFPFTMGQNQFDFLDYDTFCLQVASIVEQDKFYGIINACSSQPQKLADRVQKFIDENKLDIRLKYGAFPDRPYDSKAIWGDDKIIREIMKERY